MFCQRDICEKIVEGGGDYVLVVKDDQPSLATGIGAGLAFEAEKRRQHAAFFPPAKSCRPHPDGNRFDQALSLLGLPQVG